MRLARSSPAGCHRSRPVHERRAQLCRGAVPAESVSDAVQGRRRGVPAPAATIAALALTGLVLALGVVGAAGGALAHHGRSCAPAMPWSPSARRRCWPVRIAGRIRHARHRAVGGVRIDPVLPRRCRCTSSCSALQWSPQTAMRADQVGSSGSFGAVPLFLGTAMISGIAMLIAVPIGLFSAIYLAEYAQPAVPHLGQAAARDAGRHSDGGLRILRRADRRSRAARAGRSDGPGRWPPRARWLRAWSWAS